MLKSDLLISRYSGENIIPKRLYIQPQIIDIANEQIDCFSQCLGKTQGFLDGKLQELEGDRQDYKLTRGFAHILKNSFSTFEIVTPLEPSLLREKVFSLAANNPTIPDYRSYTLEAIANDLSIKLQKEIFPHEIEQGLYADLQENRILTQFEQPTAESLIHRYNLAQVQGIFYRATNIIVNAHRNDPGEYKLLFRYLKLFELMFYIEGDAETGFTITIDGATSIFKPNTRYGLALAKMIPALLHVTKWNLKATIQNRDVYSNNINTYYFTLDNSCGLVSHYSPSKTYDSMLEESFVKKWNKTKTDWKLEREVDLIPIPGSVMIPDFRIVHPDGRFFILEIVGFWHPKYLQKKFYQVKNASINNLILAISDRLNLEKAKVNFKELPNQVIWFKDKLSPQSVLEIIDN